jgi:hypothetical protein
MTIHLRLVDPTPAACYRLASRPCSVRVAVRSVVTERHDEVRAERFEDACYALLQLRFRNVLERSIEVIPALDLLGP